MLFYNCSITVELRSPILAGVCLWLSTFSQIVNEPLILILKVTLLIVFAVTSKLSDFAL